MNSVLPSVNWTSSTELSATQLSNYTMPKTGYLFLLLHVSDNVPFTLSINGKVYNQYSANASYLSMKVPMMLLLNKGDNIKITGSTYNETAYPNWKTQGWLL